MSTTTETRSLASKIAEVQASIERIDERRNVRVTNAAGEFQYAYDYIPEWALMKAIRPALADRNVAVFYSDGITSLEGNVATVFVSLTLVDGDDPTQTYSMRTEGMATDRGDKAVNKAKTAALRYLLWKWFLVPSDVEPEAENETKTRERPVAHVKFATDEDVAAYLADVDAAGFVVDAAQNALLEDGRDVDGERKIPEDVLKRHRAQFDQALAKIKKAQESS